jgi:serine/threonine protein kinase
MGNIFTTPPSALDLNQAIDFDDTDSYDENEESYKILNENLSILNGKFNQSKLYIVKKLNNNNTNKRLKYYSMQQINTKISDDKFQYALNKGKQLMLLDKHENIVSYLDSYQEINKIFFIMDYCYGNTLKERIELQINKDLHKKSRYFDESLIWYWFLNILNGLSYLHKHGIYHCDLKPENIFIDCKNGACKIGNFNLDKLDENYFRMLNIKNYNSLLYKPPEYRFINDYGFNLNDENLLKYLNEKCDIFSVGCILYELVYLERAILNPFLKELVLVHEQHDQEFAIDLINLIDSCLEYNYEKRLTSVEILKLESVKTHLCSIESKISYFNAYKDQIIPTIDFKRNYNCDHLKANYLKVNLEHNYKPSSIICLKFSQNLIIISLNKYLNEKDYSFLFANNIDPYVQQQIQSKLVIYSEFGEIVYEFHSYLVEKNSNLDNSSLNDGQYDRKYFNFKIYSMCIDEINSFIYLSNDLNGILRFKYMKNFQNKELILDTTLNLTAVNKKLNLVKNNIIAKCIHLAEIENNPLYDTNLLISDNFTNNLISLKFKTIKSKIDYCIEWVVATHDTKSSQQQQQQTVFQILTTNSEIICLLNDLVTIQVYYLTTGLFKRDNKHKLSSFNIDTIQALSIDSQFNIYSTDGFQFYSINLNTFELYNICETLDNNNNNVTAATNNNVYRRPFFNSIVFMQILINGKIVLLKDVVQTENSVLYILSPMFSCVQDESN